MKNKIKFMFLSIIIALGTLITLSKTSYADGQTLKQCDATNTNPCYIGHDEGTGRLIENGD